jgi:tetratricopeptide (TPR) repeat protein
MNELANVYATLNQRERAIEVLKAILQKKQASDPWVLNRLAIIYGELGDVAKQEKFYKESAKVGHWSAPWFNLALAQKNRGQWKDAVTSIEKAMTIEREAPALVLRAMLAEHDVDMKLREKLLKEAKKTFRPISLQNDWELGWCRTAAGMLDDADLKQSAEEEVKKRAHSGTDDDAPGQLPVEAGSSPESPR